ncbi:hypothetical protein GCM10010869_00590 [Mesorhizobium tianshanense]|uniref:Collagen triple helix repeat protein n=1 Tax=Mesorhizobium tianshanense TaxID=39844 RepID=A0A562MTH6_9HYPH|nr:hypothetical protein [Mesorhizobium tianshanense]TWI23150.1 hypothetical protein IQ26_06457 [Mesorhizobium tianshanense]GLS34471.1 hypothetical protein GCM10010869_00590 [Mesorhizobium tianshanense]
MLLASLLTAPAIRQPGLRVAICLTALTFILTVCPYRVAHHGLSLTLGSQAAWAKDGGQGNSGNSGNSGNAGNSGNSGTAGSSGNAGDPNSAGNASKDKAKSSEDNPPQSPVTAVNPKSKPKLYINTTTGDRIEVRGSSLGVVHSNGLSERIDDGHYEMRDAKGRTIIRRVATRSDRSRLLDMIE